MRFIHIEILVLGVKLIEILEIKFPWQTAKLLQLKYSKTGKRR